MAKKLKHRKADPTRRAKFVRKNMYQPGTNALCIICNERPTKNRFTNEKNEQLPVCSRCFSTTKNKEFDRIVEGIEEEVENG